MKDRRWQGLVLSNLGRTFSSQGQYDKALECYQKSLVLKTELKYLRGQADVLFDEGITLGKKSQRSRDSKAVINKYEQATEIYNRIGSQEKVASVALKLGNIYLALGKYDKAAECYEKTAALRR